MEVEKAHKVNYWKISYSTQNSQIVGFYGQIIGSWAGNKKTELTVS